jgi:hypothetical protein
VNNILLGKMNNMLAITLTAGATSTVIADPRINSTSVFLFDARTASAKLAAYSMYVSSVSKGSVTITHANVAAVDQNFIAAIFA